MLIALQSSILPLICYSTNIKYGHFDLFYNDYFDRRTKEINFYSS